MTRFRTIVLFVVIFATTLSAFAQTDIKAFDKIGPDACLKKLKSLGFNTSNLVWNCNGEEGDLYLEDKDGEFVETFMALDYETHELVLFLPNEL